MHIVNIMFSCAAGGIEQAFIDYCEALQMRGHQITAITHPRAFINAQLKALSIPTIHMRNFGEWDIFAAKRLQRELQTLNPDIVIAHANRAYALTSKALKGLCPLVGIVHNYTSRTERLKNADGVFATTHDLINFATRLGINENLFYHIPNMVRCNELPHRGPRNMPPVIGTMGRFVKKKGFDVYIDALKIVKQRGYRFKAILGGMGTEDKHLRRQAKKAGLADVLTFPGWIGDKKAFYNHVDVFCLPSLHEPFGIVLLEAFMYGAPVIATDTEGPSDIITPNFDAIIVKTNHAEELATAIARLLNDEQLADNLAANAFVKVKSMYAIERVGERIEKALNTVIMQWREKQPVSQAA